jgi:hypothetical protein
MPDWVTFEKIVTLLRKKDKAVITAALSMPKNLPLEYHAVVETVRQSVLADLPKLLDARLSPRKLFDQTPAYMGRYFWIEDALSEVDQHDRKRSAAWEKVTQGHDDDGSLLTMFVCIAAGAAPKTLLSDKTAASLIRKIRKTGLQSDLADAYIRGNAPEQHQDDYIRLWQDFVVEAQATLRSEHDSKLADALALLRRECNVS